jgi:hypothetical protein
MISRVEEMASESQENLSAWLFQSGIELVKIGAGRGDVTGDIWFGIRAIRTTW